MTQGPNHGTTGHTRRNEFDEEDVPTSKKLGSFSDAVFGFIFDLDTFKFGILLFAGFCTFLNLAGYRDFMDLTLTTRLDEYGRMIPVEPAADAQLISSLSRLPWLGILIIWAERITGGLVALFGAFCLWFVIQGLEIASRFNFYFPQAAENLLYRLNRKRFEAPANNNPGTKKAHRMVRTAVTTVLRILTIVGVVAYIFDIFSMGIARPWLDKIGNPLWLNCFGNSLAVFGLEVALLMHTGYKMVTLSNADQAEKDKTFN